MVVLRVKKVGTKKNPLKVGNRRQVWNGTALQTAYGKNGLTKADLKIGCNGKIVSKKASAASKKNKNLGKHLVTQRGVVPKQFRK